MLKDDDSDDYEHDDDVENVMTRISKIFKQARLLNVVFGFLTCLIC